MAKAIVAALSWLCGVWPARYWSTISRATSVEPGLTASALMMRVLMSAYTFLETGRVFIVIFLVVRGKVTAVVCGLIAEKVVCRHFDGSGGWSE